MGNPMDKPISIATALTRRDVLIRYHVQMSNNLDGLL